jgi:Fe-S-cluster containining protein
MKRNIEVSSEPEISCGDCIGLCCQDVRLVLSADEADQLEAAGTQLTPLLPANGPTGSEHAFDWSTQTNQLIRLGSAEQDSEMREIYMLLAGVSKRMGPGDGYFGMTGRCGNLTQENTCGVYESRPNACQEFSEGSVACVGLRLGVVQQMDL